MAARRILRGTSDSVAAIRPAEGGVQIHYPALSESQVTEVENYVIEGTLPSSKKLMKWHKSDVPWFRKIKKNVTEFPQKIFTGIQDIGLLLLFTFRLSGSPLFLHHLKAIT